MANVPLRTARGEEAVYYEALADGRLLYQVCADCASAIWYPRSVCPVCGSPRLDWQESTRRGVVYSFTTIHRAGHAARNDDVPYTVGLVDLDEGIRVLGNLSADLATDAIGRRVLASTDQHDGDVTTLLFSPIKDAE